MTDRRSISAAAMAAFAAPVLTQSAGARNAVVRKLGLKICLENVINTVVAHSMPHP